MQAFLSRSYPISQCAQCPPCCIQSHRGPHVDLSSDELTWPAFQVQEAATKNLVYNFVSIGAKWVFSQLTMLDACGDMIWPCICLGGCEIKVIGSSGRVVSKLRVHACHFSGVRSHSPCRFARLNVAPYHGRHITFVVHEASIEVWGIVGIRGLDMG